MVTNLLRWLLIRELVALSVFYFGYRKHIQVYFFDLQYAKLGGNLEKKNVRNAN